MNTEEIYTGNEVAVELSPGALTHDLFEVRPSHLPPDCLPIVDEASGQIVGYRYGSSGYWEIYDVEGNLVEVGELPLESPLIDPIDLLAGGLLGIVRGLFRGVARSTSRGLIVSLGASGVRSVSAKATTRLLGVVRKFLTPGGLKFTATTARHMASSSRHVPIQILKLGLRHGKQLADPQGVPGALRYVVPMLKNGKEYTLEIVLRVKDSTVLHYLYK